MQLTPVLEVPLALCTNQSNYTNITRHCDVGVIEVINNTSAMFTNFPLLLFDRDIPIKVCQWTRALIQG